MRFPALFPAPLNRTRFTLKSLLFSAMHLNSSSARRYQAQVNEYKFEIERLQRELQEVKKRYYEQKRREHLTMGDDAADSKGFKLQQPSAGSRWAARQCARFFARVMFSIGLLEEASVWALDNAAAAQSRCE